MTDMPSVTKLNKDLRVAARTLSDQEARYLVDQYYRMQKDRIVSGNRERALSANEEPNEVLGWLSGQSFVLENQIKVSLDAYSANHPLGAWARSVKGVGPVLAAALLAYIDMRKAPSVGHIWRYAGLDPTVKWRKGQKRPFNAQLKVTCWKIGDSFVKIGDGEDAYYGRIYRQRKAYEIARNEAGGNAETARLTLAERNFEDKETRAIYESGKLPAGRIDLRARRYAVKLFLAHYHEMGCRIILKTEPPKPYPIAHLAHVHFMPAPVAEAAE